MERYGILIGKKINLEFNGFAINSYKITSMTPTNENMDGQGKLYKCSVDWEKVIIETESLLSFDTKTLDDLIDKGKAVCPIFSNLYYKLDLCLPKTNNN
jgi:hypothetical protein